MVVMERTHLDHANAKSSINNSTRVIVNATVKNDAPIGNLTAFCLSLSVSRLCVIVHL